jgi:hypothetical protein
MNPNKPYEITMKCHEDPLITIKSPLKKKIKSNAQEVSRRASASEASGLPPSDSSTWLETKPLMVESPNYACQLGIAWI